MHQKSIARVRWVFYKNCIFSGIKQNYVNLWCNGNCKTNRVHFKLSHRVASSQQQLSDSASPPPEGPKRFRIKKTQEGWVKVCDIFKCTQPTSLI